MTVALALAAVLWLGLLPLLVLGALACVALHEWAGILGRSRGCPACGCCPEAP